MNSHIIKLLCFTLLFILSTPLFSNTCEGINNIALICLNRNLLPSEMKSIGDCSDPKNKALYIDYIMQNEAFIGRLILIMRLELLQGTTADNIREATQDFDLIMFSQPDNYNWAKEESEKMYRLYHLPGDYQHGKISFEDIYITYFNNWTYDQQNMGIDNFISSTFAYSLGRAPTKVEFENAKKMISNTEVDLFYKKGASKLDYLNILTHNDNFFEHQLKYWHYYFLNQYPTDMEIYQILIDVKRQNGEVNTINIIKYIISNKI